MVVMGCFDDWGLVKWGKWEIWEDVWLKSGEIVVMDKKLEKCLYKMFEKVNFKVDFNKL